MSIEVIGIPCRQMETRVCPRSLPNGCQLLCYRFEVNETPDVIAVWAKHLEITDEMFGVRSDLTPS